MANDLEFWEFGGEDDEHTLADLVNRVLDKGVVIVGDVTISVRRHRPRLSRTQRSAYLGGQRT